MNQGQIVVKLNGRFAGYYGFIKEVIDDTYVKIGIPLSDNVIKIKKSNLKHILPIPGKVIPEDAIGDDKKSIEAFKSLGFIPGKRIKID